MNLFQRNNQNDENREEQNSQQNPAVRSGIMSVASAYLIYVGYKLIRDVLNDTEGSGSPIFIAAGVFFMVFGAVYLVIQLRLFMARRKEAEEAAAEQEIIDSEMTEVISEDNAEEENQEAEENAESAAATEEAEDVK